MHIPNRSPKELEIVVHLIEGPKRNLQTAVYHGFSFGYFCPCISPSKNTGHPGILFVIHRPSGPKAYPTIEKR